MNLPRNNDNGDGDDKHQVLLALESDCCLLCSAILLFMLAMAVVVVMVCVYYTHIFISTFIMYLPVLQVFSSIYLHPFHSSLISGASSISSMYSHIISIWLTDKRTNTRMYACMCVYAENWKWKPFRDNRKRRKNSYWHCDVCFPRILLPLAVLFGSVPKLWLIWIWPAHCCTCIVLFSLGIYYFIA